MDAAEPSLLLTASFVVLVVAVHLAVFAAVGRATQVLGAPAEIAARRATAAGLAVAGWLALTGYVASRGLLLDFESTPPPFLLLMLPTAMGTTVLAFSRLGTTLATGLAWPVLVGFQLFRVPVELVLVALYRQGVVPVQMTFEGRNFDILAGLSAAVVAALARRRPLPAWALLAWNVAGVALLVNIVGVAVLSAPFSFGRFHEGPANTIVMHAPWVWLPTFLVQVAWFGHLLVLRKLVLERRGETAALA